MENMVNNQFDNSEFETKIFKIFSIINNDKNIQSHFNIIKKMIDNIDFSNRQIENDCIKNILKMYLLYMEKNTIKLNIENIINNVLFNNNIRYVSNNNDKCLDENDYNDIIMYRIIINNSKSLSLYFYVYKDDQNIDKTIEDICSEIDTYIINSDITINYNIIKMTS